MKKQLINIEPVKDQVRTKLLEKYNSTIFMNTDVVDVRVDIKEILEEYIAAKQLTEPTVYITTEAYVKMRKLVDDTETEIGWYGTVTKCPGLDNVYVIEDILVYPQTVTGATCEQDEDKMFEFEMSLTTEQVNHKRFHGHSHVNMGVTPSGVDEQFYQDILTQVNDFFIITITNKRKEYTVRFYDMENNILYSDVPIQLLLDNGTTLDKWYTDSKGQLTNRVSITNTLNTKIYTPEDQDKCWSRYKSPYDYLEQEDDMEWDPQIGYITKEEKNWYKNELKKESKAIRRGRPRKRR